MKDLSIEFGDGTTASFSVDEDTYDAVMNRGDWAMLERLKQYYQEAMAGVTYDMKQAQIRLPEITVTLFLKKG